MGDVLRKVGNAELKLAMLKALMVGPVRELGLLERTPAEFKRRAWPTDPSAIAVVACACGAYSLGIKGQAFLLPPALLAHGKWAAMCERLETNLLTAAQIVEEMELQALTKPAAVVVTLAN